VERDCKLARQNARPLLQYALLALRRGRCRGAEFDRGAYAEHDEDCQDEELRNQKGRLRLSRRQPSQDRQLLEPLDDSDEDVMAAPSRVTLRCAVGMPIPIASIQQRASERLSVALL